MYLTITNLSFSYGSIYFSSDAIKGSVPATILDDVPYEVKEMVSTKFTIGPSVDRGFWSKERSDVEIDRGPCMSTLSFRLVPLLSANRCL